MNQDKSLRVFSFGGGVQSVAVMVLQAARRIQPYDAFIFANVGVDSENPATIQYFKEFVEPWCEEFKIPLVMVQKTLFGKPQTLLEAINRDDNSVPIPVYMPSGSPGRRVCTSEYKIRVIDKWIRVQKPTHAIVGLGISMDESKRMSGTEWHDKEGKKPFGFMKKREYPLIELNIRRSDCEQIILDAGLPLPPKSACWFCPFHSPNTWIDMKRDDPEQFSKVVDLEHSIRAKRERMGRDPAYIHSRLQPIEIAVGDQMALFEASCTNQCNSGYCFT